MTNFINFWQHIPSHLNPDLISIGSFKIRYYSLMYIIAFTIVFFLTNYRLKKEKIDIKKSIVESYFTWGILGIILGARFGYAIFYGFDYFSSNPLEIFIPFNLSTGQYVGLSGMSYHGGVIGVLIATYLFCKKYKIEFWKFLDLFVPSIPIAYFFGRIGNFINGELYGRETSSAIGMYFPMDELNLLRHPSQLYEAFFEGIVLFVFLWFIRKKIKTNGVLSGLYLIGYGTVRFFIEFFRQPDPQLGLFFGDLFSMGQMLCFSMIITGSLIIYYNKKKRNNQ